MLILRRDANLHHDLQFLNGSFTTDPITDIGAIDQEKGKNFLDFSIVIIRFDYLLTGILILSRPVGTFVVK